MSMSVLGERYEDLQAPKLPPHLTEHQRDKLLVDPEVCNADTRMLLKNTFFV